MTGWAPHAEAGARFAADGVSPLQYGDAAAAAEEYRALRESAGLAELVERTVLVVSGPLRQKFLHGLLSNDVGALTPGQGCAAALMDVRGHLLALLRALVVGDEVLLELPAERLDRVEALLAHYRVAAPVRFAARPTMVLALMGPQAATLVGAAGLEPGGDEAHAERELAGHPVRVIRAGDLPGGGLVIHCAPDAGADVWRALVARGARPVGRHALDARRIETGQPWYGFDVNESHLLHETGLLARYHSASKGCYVGQEVVARLEGRGGHVNKALRGLCLEAPAAPGATLRVGEREVGRLMTTAVSPRNGAIALGYVHRDHFEAGSACDAEGTPARVMALPFAEEGA